MAGCPEASWKVAAGERCCAPAEGLTRHPYVQKSERAKARERKAGVFSGRIETHQGKSQTPCSLDGQGEGN